MRTKPEKPDDCDWCGVSTSLGAKLRFYAGSGSSIDPPIWLCRFCENVPGSVPDQEPGVLKLVSLAYHLLKRGR